MMDLFGRLAAWLRRLWSRRFKAPAEAAGSGGEDATQVEAGVGPILGAVTSHSARVFTQARRAVGEQGRLFAVLSIRVGDKSDFSRFFVRKLNRTFADSTVFVLTGLAPDRRYDYGVAHIRAANTAAAMAFAARWETSGADRPYSLHTRSETPARHRLFLGSCRYMLRLGDLGYLFDGRGDKAYRSMSAIHAVGRVDNAVFVGDQIYADDLNKAQEDTSFKEFRDRYEAAFGTRHFRALAASLPVIHAMDDHEIEDNFPASMTRRDRMVKLPAALHAYDIFQVSYSPLYRLRPATAWPAGTGDFTTHEIAGRPNRYWYSHRDGIVDYFVMDLRTERNPERAEIVSAEQMAALTAWLADDSPATYKLIASGVPLVPEKAEAGVEDLVNAGKPDKWDYSPRQRADLVAACFRARDAGRRVVLLSGDIHQSGVGVISDDRGVGFYNVVSSPIYWPWPHGSLDNFDDAGETCGARWRFENRSNHDGFAVLDFTAAGMSVAFHDRKAPYAARLSGWYDWSSADREAGSR